MDIQKLESKIKNKVKNANVNGVVLGLSGGLDSTVSLFLCVKALGPNKVLGLFMPEKKEDIDDDIVNVVNNFGIDYKTIGINSIINAFEENLGDADKNTTGNLKARIRMSILYYCANRDNLLVVGTSNKSEIMQGYFTLHGDGASDIKPLKGLYKTEVFDLAKNLGLPESIIKKKPTAGLWPGQTDEKDLGISYKNLDKILPIVSKDVNTIKKQTGISEDKIKKVKKRFENTRFKREKI